MLSYRHGFHAGNHADLLKHSVLLAIIDYLNQKEKPYCYIDTHSGAGLYSLTDAYAAKNSEYETGISRLWNVADLPPMLDRYVNLIKSFNRTNETLSFYPGSPLLAHRAMRTTDSLRLFELHPSDYKLLEQNCSQMGRKTQVKLMNGFAGLKSVLPPVSRRGLVLIDPPYEDKSDYQTVVKSIQDGLKRFETGTYALWYPCLQRIDISEMISSLKALAPKNWLNVALHVQTPATDGFGMYGSGLFIINPPWTLSKTLEEELPFLVKVLAIDDGAQFILEDHSC